MVLDTGEDHKKENNFLLLTNLNLNLITLHHKFLK